MSEENKAAMRRIHEEALTKGNLAILDEVLADDFIDHSIPPGQPQGAEGARQMMTMFRTAFPDLRVTEEDMIAEGDKVVARASVSGTHRGDLMGIPPTGKQVTLSFIEIARFSGGKCVERWEQADMLGLMQQLGVVSPPG